MTKMSNFENYLIEQGFIRHCFRKGKWVVYEGTHPYYSTMGDLVFGYIHSNTKETYTFGLHEYKKPPTLIYPRPIGVYTDDTMNRILLYYSPEEIITAIKTNFIYKIEDEN